MSDITKGEIVEATVAAYGYHVRPNSRGRREAEWVTAGMELEVTAVVGDYLNMRLPGSKRGVFRFSRSDVRRVRQVGCHQRAGSHLIIRRSRGCGRTLHVLPSGSDSALSSIGWRTLSARQVVSVSSAFR